MAYRRSDRQEKAWLAMLAFNSSISTAGTVASSSVLFFTVPGTILRCRGRL